MITKRFTMTFTLGDDVSEDVLNNVIGEIKNILAESLAGQNAAYEIKPENDENNFSFPYGYDPNYFKDLNDKMKKEHDKYNVYRKPEFYWGKNAGDFPNSWKDVPGDTPETWNNQPTCGL